MGNRYLVVSDLHLADVENHPDGWKAYKGTRYLFDEEFAALLEKFVREGTGRGDQLTLILNGDIFDFDVVTAVPADPPWPVTRFERKRGLNATAPKSAWKLELILSHHPGFVTALAAFLAGGHQIIYVLGNHDREFHFSEVKQALREAIAEASNGREVGMERLRFEPWFYYVPGEIYAEHGQQYDYFTSFRHLLWPVVRVQNQEALALPMGNLSNRYLMSRMGFFNPHASDFILTVYSYVVHFFRHYAFSRRGILFNWLWGSILVVAKLLKIKAKLLRQPPKEHGRRQAEIAHRFDLPLQQVKALGQLQRPPITSRIYRMIRELWIDRLAIAVIMTLATIALAVSPIPLWIKLMVPLSIFPLVHFLYEWLAQGETIFTIEKEIPKRARAICKLLPTKVITFGHTHKPRLFPLSKETFFVDTGTWAPVMSPKDGTRLLPGLRNYLLVIAEPGKPVRLRLDSWLPASDE